MPTCPQCGAPTPNGTRCPRCAPILPPPMMRYGTKDAPREKYHPDGRRRFDWRDTSFQVLLAIVVYLGSVMAIVYLGFVLKSIRGR